MEKNFAMTPGKTAICTVALSLLAAVCLQGAGYVYRSDNLRIRHRGMIRNLLLTSRTLAFFPSPGKHYLSDTQRFRTDWRVDLRRAFRFRAVYDHEIRLGDYLETVEYKLAKSIQHKQPALLDLDHYLAERKHADWRHRLYRLNFEVNLYPVRLIAGRQQISWGTGYFWNPTDLFNPTTFLLVEPDERFGTDALNLELGLGSLSQVQAAWAPTSDPHRSRGAVRLKTNYREYDLSFMGGWMFRDRVTGADFSGQIAGAGFRGEWLHNFAWQRNDFDQLVLGLNYRFSAGFVLNAEYLYNSGPLSEQDLMQSFDSPVFYQTGSVTTFSRHLAGLHGDYQVHPLVHLAAYLSIDLEHGGVFAGPRFSWNFLPNSDLEIGAQFGSGDGEFRWLENSYFVASSWYF